MSLTVEKCLQAWTNSLKQMNAKADIVFFGDSLTYNGDFASVYPNKVVCNLGLRGDTIKGLIDRLQQVIMLNPKYVFLMAGINDITNNDPEQFETQYEILIKHLKCIENDITLVVQSILPVNSVDFHVSCNNEQIRIYNEIIANLANRYHIFDGIHLKTSEYSRWYNEILNKVYI